ncbi:MAG: DUF4153 domain-containing protein, partial [Bacteroidota bacterium]|nr:DUF4153 domain-containing protein [Bacteroidota bacterium]
MEIADKIRENLNDPESLEKLYREDQKSFASGFDSIYTDINNAELARYWKIRLVYDKAQSKANKFPGLDVLVLIVTCLLTGFLMEIPSFFRFGAKDVLFYERNTSIIVFLGLTAYSIWINRTFDKKKLVFIALAFMIPLTYINL